MHLRHSCQVKFIGHCSSVSELAGKPTRDSVKGNTSFSVFHLPGHMMHLQHSCQVTFIGHCSIVSELAGKPTRDSVKGNTSFSVFHLPGHMMHLQYPCEVTLGTAVLSVTGRKAHKGLCQCYHIPSVFHMPGRMMHLQHRVQRSQCFLTSQREPLDATRRQPGVKHVLSNSGACRYVGWRF